MVASAHLGCAAQGCDVEDRTQLYRIGYCGGFGKGQGARIVAQRKKGVTGDCDIRSGHDDGAFRRGDVLCPDHTRQLKAVYMFTAHPVQKASASEKQAMAEMALPSTRYCVGVAPTSRGNCRECSNTIEEGSLRFGIEHRFGAHYEARWRHWPCAKLIDLERAFSAARGDWSAIQGFDELSADLQKVVLGSQTSAKRKAESISAESTSARFQRTLKVCTSGLIVDLDD